MKHSQMTIKGLTYLSRAVTGVVRSFEERLHGSLETENGVMGCAMVRSSIPISRVVVANLFK